MELLVPCTKWPFTRGVSIQFFGWSGESEEHMAKRAISYAIPYSLSGPQIYIVYICHMTYQKRLMPLKFNWVIECRATLCSYWCIATNSTSKQIIVTLTVHGRSGENRTNRSSGYTPVYQLIARTRTAVLAISFVCAKPTRVNGGWILRLCSPGTTVTRQRLNLNTFLHYGSCVAFLSLL